MPVGSQFYVHMDNMVMRFGTASQRVLELPWYVAFGPSTIPGDAKSS